MPPAAIPIAGAIAGGVGSGASAAGGKKAQKHANQLANQQMQLQQDQFGLAKQQLGAGNATLAPASGYFNALLQGGQAARNAVGPYASLVGQAGHGTANAIAAGTPRGGEQNLAQAQNTINTGNQIEQLYKGLQPMAAQGLESIGGLQLGSAGGFNPGANTGGAFGSYANSQNNANQAGQGFGGLLFQSLNKLKQGGGGGAAPTQSYGYGST